MKDIINYRGRAIEIVQDSDPQNPRKEFDHEGTKMVCFHNRYNLGDVNGRKEYGSGEDFIRALAGDFTSEDVGELALTACQKLVEDNLVILPLYLYDHSGITMSVAPFSCPWDSGQVGWIYMSHKAAMANWSVKSIDAPVDYKDGKPAKSCRERAVDLLIGEVAEYDQYLTGDVWGYVVGDDSCWGFYGREYCEQEAKSVVDCQLKAELKAKLAKLRGYIVNKVPVCYRQFATA